MPTITPFLWFDGTMAEAFAFYLSVFPDSKVESEQRTADGFLMGAVYEVAGQRVMGLNAPLGQPRASQHSDAFSFYVSVRGQAEVDRYWDALLADGGTPVQCGWLTDRFGVTWQIVPEELFEVLWSDDPAVVEYGLAAMRSQTKIVIAELTR